MDLWVMLMLLSGDFEWYCHSPGNLSRMQMLGGPWMPLATLEKMLLWQPAAGFSCCLLPPKSLSGTPPHLADGSRVPGSTESPSRFCCSWTVCFLFWNVVGAALSHPAAQSTGTE
jgi:hypothetical protein